MTYTKENPVSLAGEHGADSGVQIGKVDRSDTTSTPENSQPSLGLDDWRARVIRDAEAFMRRKGKEAGKPRRRGRRGRHGQRV